MVKYYFLLNFSVYQKRVQEMQVGPIYTHHHQSMVMTSSQHACPNILEVLAPVTGAVAGLQHTGHCLQSHQGVHSPFCNAFLATTLNLA